MYPKLLVLVGLTAYFAQLATAAGVCSEADEASELQKCEKAFVDKMIKDSDANCTVEVNKIYECLETLSKKCYPQVNEKVIKQVVSIGMKQIQALQFYCTETKLNYIWSNVAPNIKKQLPSCAVSFDESANSCCEEFRSHMQKTPKDNAAVYRSYEDSKKCMQKACETSSAKILISDAIILLCIGLISKVFGT